MALLADALDRRIVGLAIPALGALAVEPLYVLADTAIVGHLGTNPLAGLALAATVLLLAVAGCNFLAYGTTQRLAHHLGAGREREAAAVGVQALWLCAFIGAPLALAFEVLAAPLGRALGGHGEVLSAAVTYLRISALGLPFVLVALVGHGVLRGVSDLRTPLVVAVAANVANLVFEIVAVYGLGLGIAGSAWSTVIVQVVAGLAYLRALAPHLAAAPSCWPERAELAPLVAAGRHLLVRVGAVLAELTLATAVAARVDAPTLAAHQIAASLASFLALALDALAIPAQILVAGALGRHDGAGASHTARRVERLSLVTGIGLGIVLLALAPVLSGVFTADGAVAARATAAFALLAVAMVPAGIAMGLDGVLIGAADYRFLGRASVAEVVVVLPLLVVTWLHHPLGIIGVWSAYATWMLARAVVNHQRVKGARWQFSVP